MEKIGRISKVRSKLKYIHSYLQNLNVLFFQLISDKIIYQSNYVKNLAKKKSSKKKCYYL